MTASLKLGLALALLSIAGCAAVSGDDDDDDEGGGDAAPEGPMCSASEVSVEQVQARQDIDMVFAVGNTASMADEQIALAAQFPRLITVFATGDVNEDGVTDFPPVQSLRLAVVSTDLGLPGIDSIEGCVGLGDEGLFQSTGDASTTGCSPTYDPAFLTFSADNGDEPAAVASDLACIAALGTGGCTIQQPLESMLKAVWPANDQQVTFVTDPNGFGMYGQAGPGAPNGDFFRNDSLIALVVVTDAEDCSSRRMDHFVPSASPTALGTRCYYEGQRGPDSNLFQVNRYIELFKMLRGDNEQSVFFAVIAGVPPSLTDPAFKEGFDFTAPGQTAAYADAVLSAPDMSERIDDQGTLDPLDDGTVPSCNRGENAEAYPPRRLVEVAKGMGDNGIIESICQDDLTPAFNSLIERIRTQLGVPCLPRPIDRNSEGKIDCRLLWELPRSMSCDDLPFLSDLGRVNAMGWPVCEVDQLAVDDGSVDGDDGWYYDDFSETAQQSCVGGLKQRIAFSESAEPPAGSVVRLSCFDAAHFVELPDAQRLATRQQAGFGSRCDLVERNGQVLEGDSACERYLQNGDTSELLFCHESLNTCVLACGEDDDCPELWFCDDTSATVSAAGGAMCSPGVCSAGPGSASAGVVGDPCLPYSIPQNGFDDATVYVEGNQADCGGGACIVYHLDGDPRGDCPARGGCLQGPGFNCGDALRCADSQEVEKRAYCTCRCDAPDGFAECECPDGFSCVEALSDNVPPEIAGSYCVRNTTVSTR